MKQTHLRARIILDRMDDGTYRIVVSNHPTWENKQKVGLSKDELALLVKSVFKVFMP